MRVDCCDRSRKRKRILALAISAFYIVFRSPCFFLPQVARMGQGIASTQFYLYGKRHFTQSGWEKHSASYPTPDPLDTVDVSGRAYIVTGANAGIGREITSFLARKGGKVYMICRDEARGNSAREDIISQDGVQPNNLVVVQGDMGLQRDVQRVASSIGSMASQGIDALVCNAGALLNERTLSDEGVEVTFATHLLFGSYLLTKLLLPSLRNAAAQNREPRVVMVSSGGMYNVAFPAWNVAASEQDDATGIPSYDGQLAYAYAKRAQVLLCERFAELEKESQSTNAVTFVSAHPGWTGTKAVREAYGESASWLEPMRTTWQGAEGICWLCVTPATELTPGAFYLDREPQVKHMAGPFFTEGSFTKNTREEVDDLLSRLAARTGHSASA
eukprot:TRINITY_DN3563_c0_g8_i1.p1 TRINITY_DN3563_c0_g8~~TRINITY_DN3563_c0_g8_i1.p1  ORF type:complete len:388 (-),score=37.54 TRINITY_DN3563_c0_g8_i1:272-1435(-)